MAHLLYAGRILGKAKMAGNIAAYLPSSIALSLQGPEAWGCDLLSHTSRGLHVSVLPFAGTASPSRTQSKLRPMIRFP